MSIDIVMEDLKAKASQRIGIKNGEKLLLFEMIGLSEFYDSFKQPKIFVIFWNNEMERVPSVTHEHGEILRKKTNSSEAWKQYQKARFSFRWKVGKVWKII